MKKIIVLAICLTLAGCSYLGIYVVDDSLSAAQHNDLGFAYESQGKLESAEKEYKRAIKKDKKWYVPYFNLGNVYFKSAETGKAIKYYRKALKRNSENPDLMNNLAFALLESGDSADAEKWIEKALSIEQKPEYLDTQNEIRRRFNLEKSE